MVNMGAESIIMDYFFMKPDLEVNIRELSRLLDINHMTVRTNLIRLVDEGYLRLKKKDLEHLFSLDRNSSKVKNKKRLWNIQRTMDSGLISYLDELYESPKSIILFGSYSFGEDSKESDIDIAIQTKIKKKPVLDKFERYLGHEVQLFNFSLDDDKNLLNSIFNGIVLKGRIQ